jgi:hypothetical protein
MKIDIILTEQDLRHLVLEHLRTALGDIGLQEKDVKIEVMTKNNYRVKEWEQGAFRAHVEKIA